MNILDPKFKYVPAATTDIRQTFKRIRKEQKEAEERAKAINIEQVKKVRKLG